MSIFGRIAGIFQARTNDLLNKLEDPNATLDLSYEKMIVGLQETKRHLADVLAEQKSLERQMVACQTDGARAEENAKIALVAGREDLAKAALGEKQAALQKFATLQEAHHAIAPQVTKLIEYQNRLADRIEQFRTQKEVMKSSYAAAQAQVKVTESLTGIGSNLGGVGDAMRRAEDKVAGMRSKADAMDSLIEAGVLNEVLDNRSHTEKELLALRTGSAIDIELERMKAELGQKRLE